MLREELATFDRAATETPPDSAAGTIFNVQPYSIHDGPGIRTTVFLKGCGLSCWWCHNPESQSPGPELIFREGRCIACGACTFVCPTGAVQMEHERVEELRAAGAEHPCRYTLMGFLADAVCSLNYECARCEIDQKFRAAAGTHPMLARAAAKGRKKARR